MNAVWVVSHRRLEVEPRLSWRVNMAVEPIASGSATPGLGPAIKVALHRRPSGRLRDLEAESP